MSSNWVVAYGIKVGWFEASVAQKVDNGSPLLSPFRLRPRKKSTMVRHRPSLSPHRQKFVKGMLEGDARRLKGMLKGMLDCNTINTVQMAPECREPTSTKAAYS
jgi:hypothetical protein